MTSVIYGRTDNSSDENFRICKTATDDTCNAATDLMIIQYFALCEKDADINCIEEVWARDANGVKIPGVYQRHLPASGDADFPGEPRMNLPASKGSGFVVKFAGVKHSGGTDEYLVALRNFTRVFKKSGESAANYQIGVQGLVGAINPFEIVKGDYRAIQTMQGYGSNGGIRVTPNGDTCFATEQGICAASRDFPVNYRFGLTMRLSQSVVGWFHGRIASPTILTSTKNSTSVIQIEAKPVRVAALDFMVPTAEVDKRARDMIFNGEEWGVSGGPDGSKIVTGLSEKRAQTLLQLFTPNFKDQATRTQEYWTFKTLQSARDDSIDRCSKNAESVSGIVTTNSLLYSDGPPTFNAKESSLDYEVASPHFESNGKEAVGTYDLLLRSDVARCIYGFSKAPIRATLEVLSNDGSAKVATTVINERDGWLSMSASGFGFSAPIVRAKITQEQEVVTPSPTPTPVVTATPSPSPVESVTSTPTASPSPSPTKSSTVLASKKITITCTKGKVVKKITAVNPKCPAGYKKK